MMTTHDIAVSFGLKRQGREYRGSCPLCQANKLELAVWNKPEGFGFHCYYGACDSHELFRLLIGQEAFAPSIAVNNPADAERTEWALRIWNETINAKGTLAEKYLKSRGITGTPVDIRFHPGLKHTGTGQIFPAMAAAVRDIDGNLRAIHRTFLDWTGTKANVKPVKKTLGPVGGYAIHLAAPGETLGIAEGTETALSAMQMSGLPVWSAINAGNMKRLILPESVKDVVIFADNGGPGIKAANEAAAVFHQDGRNVRIAYPPDGYGDFNDLLKGGVA